MVTYQSWTATVFEVAKDEGAQFENISDGANVVSLAADIWRERGEELKTATAVEARNIARQEIEVR